MSVCAHEIKTEKEKGKHAHLIFLEQELKLKLISKEAGWYYRVIISNCAKENLMNVFAVFGINLNETNVYYSGHWYTEKLIGADILCCFAESSAPINKWKTT